MTTPMRLALAALLLLPATSLSARSPAPLAAEAAKLPTTGAPRPVAPVLLSDPYEAAQLGIDWLMSELCNWSQTTAINVDCTNNTRKSCFGCHVQAEPVLGLARSVTRCYQLDVTPCSQPGDASPIEYATRFIAACQRKDCILGTPVCGSGPDATTLDREPPNLGSIGHYPDCGSNAGPASIHPIIQSAHGGLNLAGYTRYIAPTYSANVLALAKWWMTKQEPSGAWTPDRLEAPVDQGEVFVASSAVMTMNVARPFANPIEQSMLDSSIARAMTWLQARAPATMQDESFGLLMALEGGLPRADPFVQGVIDSILAQQNADGGWSERVGLESNAYATGQAMNALIEAGLPLDDARICRGIAWLVVAQNADGSWDMGTPGVTTDSTRNSKFTATIWPVLALGSLNPWGASVSVPSDTIETCDGTFTWDATVTHHADTACGLFSRDDVFDAWAENDLGDIVTVDPPTFTLPSGGTASVRVTWTRLGPLPAPGTISTTTLHLSSQGAAAVGCPLDTTAELRIVVPADVTPTALGPTLRVTKQGLDGVLTWTPLAGSIAAHDVVSLACATRGGCVTRPVRAVLDAATPLASVPTPLGTTTLSGLCATGGDEVVYLKIRAVSQCYFRPGPTCDRSCTDPNRCDWSCP